MAGIHYVQEDEVEGCVVTTSLLNERMGAMSKDSSTEDNRHVLFYWFGLSVLLVVADYFSGPFIQFPVTYLIPVALASWYNGKRWGLVYAIILPLLRWGFNAFAWTIPWTILETSINALIRMAVLSSFALIIDRTASQTRILSRHVQMLEGLLPICSYCKNIRDDNSEWHPIEKYIQERTPAKFTHGICPDCLRKHYGEMPWGQQSLSR